MLRLFKVEEGLVTHFSPFFFFKFFFFLMRAILKTFIEFVTVLLLFYDLVIWPRGM